MARWWWDGDAGDRPETPPRGLQGRHRRKRKRLVGWRHVIDGRRGRGQSGDWSTAGVVARLLVVFVLGLVLGALLQLAAWWAAPMTALHTWWFVPAAVASGWRCWS